MYNVLGMPTQVSWEDAPPSFIWHLIPVFTTSLFPVHLTSSSLQQRRWPIWCTNLSSSGSCVHTWRYTNFLYPLQSQYAKFFLTQCKFSHPIQFSLHMYVWSTLEQMTIIWCICTAITVPIRSLCYWCMFSIIGSMPGRCCMKNIYGERNGSRNNHFKCS